MQCANCGGELGTGGVCQRCGAIDATLRCPNCGANINEDMEACPLCGIDFDWQEADQGQVPLVMEYVICTSCGREVGIDSLYCNYCGQSMNNITQGPNALAVQQGALGVYQPVANPHSTDGFHQFPRIEHVCPKCPKCGEEIDYGARSCDKCGAEIAWENRSSALITMQPPEERQIVARHTLPRTEYWYPPPKVYFDSYNNNRQINAHHLKVADHYPRPHVIFSTV